MKAAETFQKMKSETLESFHLSNGGTTPISVHVIEQLASLRRCVVAGMELILNPARNSDDALMKGNVPPEVSAALRFELTGALVVCLERGSGFTSLLLAAMAGSSGRVICFAADESDGALIGENAKLNRAPNVSIRTAKLGGCHLPMSGQRSEGLFSSIDECVPEKPDLIVLPTASVDLLAGAFRALNEKRPIVITGCSLSTVEREGYSLYRFSRLLVDSGYVLCRSNDLEPFRSWDDLVRYCCDVTAMITALPEETTVASSSSQHRLQQKNFIHSHTPGRSWLQELARFPFKNQRPVIVDGGTNRGQLLGELLSIYPDAEAHCFEPNPAACEYLKARFGHLQKIQISASALGESDRKAEFSINAYDETSSLLSAASFDAHLPFMHTEQKLEVTVTSFDSYARSAQLDWIDLVKLDLQGYELPALKGMAETLPRMGLVVCEVQFVPSYQGQTRFGELDAYLTNAGFRLYNLTNTSTNTLSGQMLSTDALWLNERLYPYTRFPELWERDLKT